MAEIKIGQNYIIPGTGIGNMPEIARVEVIGVEFALRPILNMFDEDVRVRFSDGGETIISGMSLRMGGRLQP